MEAVWNIHLILALECYWDDEFIGKCHISSVEFSYFFYMKNMWNSGCFYVKNLCEFHIFSVSKFHRKFRLWFSYEIHVSWHIWISYEIHMCGWSGSVTKNPIYVTKKICDLASLRSASVAIKTLTRLKQRWYWDSQYYVQKFILISV